MSNIPLTFEELQAKFKALSPKERHNRLQGLFAAICEQRAAGGTIDDETIELFKALSKSFDISIKFDELDTQGELFDGIDSVSIDIKGVRAGHVDEDNGEG